MGKREFMRRLQAAMDAARESASRHDGSKYGRALAPEGFEGGYLSALYDVHAMLVHGYPHDSRGFWRKKKE